MRNPTSIIFVTSLLVAPLLGGACAPLTDLGGSESDGGANGNNPSSDGGGSFGDGGVGNTSATVDPSFLIYVMSEALELYSFNPTTNQFVDIAKTDCKGVPHSIAIDRSGKAYLLAYDSGQNNGTETWLQQLDLGTGACTSLSYSPNQGFSVFGMAFSANGSGSDETLYVQGDEYLGGATGLGTLDPTTGQLELVPTTGTPIFGGQLTGTADGRLFSLFYPGTDLGPVSFAQIDKTNGNPISPSVQNFNTSDFSLAYWGGDFYFFTSTGYTSPQVSTVTRYSPGDGTTTNVATLGNTILVAAGVSTSAPQ